LLRRRRCADGEIDAGTGTLADASASRIAMTMAIPYAGYLAIAALLWLASGAVPASP
jgi:hypothetical protein